jgi:tellurite resistance protein TerC
MIPDTLWLWLGFTGFVLAMLALDLGVVNRTAHVVSYREAALWSGVWIGLALAFNVVLYLWRGPDVALQFFTGYVIEKALSVDNIFIFVLIFSTFAVPAAYQHRVLFWGVLGALVMRGALILGGAASVATFHDDIRKTYEELPAKGVEFAEAPTQQFWGWWAMFKDSDGNIYGLGQRGE